MVIRPPATYYPSMDRSSPSAADSAAEVSAALTPRAAEISADIYHLIVQQIPQLRGGVSVAALLRAYRIGSARFQDLCLQELGRRSDHASIISAARSEERRGGREWRS